MVVFVGAVEIAVAIRFLAPGLTGVAPVLVLVMGGAVWFHARRAEVAQTVVTLAPGDLAAFVVYYRGMALPL